MHVFGHDHVTIYAEIISATDSFKGREEKVAEYMVRKIRAPVVTTKGDEV